MKVKINSYLDAKEKFPNAVILIRKGNFYEAFEESALIMHYLMGFRLSEGWLGVKIVKKTGIPAGGISGFLLQLERAKVSFVLIENYETRYIKRFRDEFYYKVLQEYNGGKKTTHIGDKKIIDINTKVTVEYIEDAENETYYIQANNIDADVMKNEISEDSLIAKSLIGRIEGESVVITFPTGISKTLKIVEVI